jgi:hypothetical protein
MGLGLGHRVADRLVQDGHVGVRAEQRLGLDLAVGDVVPDQGRAAVVGVGAACVFEPQGAQAHQRRAVGGQEPLALAGVGPPGELAVRSLAVGRGLGGEGLQAGGFAVVEQGVQGGMAGDLGRQAQGDLGRLVGLVEAQGPRHRRGRRSLRRGDGRFDGRLRRRGGLALAGRQRDDQAEDGEGFHGQHGHPS